MTEANIPNPLEVVSIRSVGAPPGLAGDDSSVGALTSYSARDSDDRRQAAHSGFLRRLTKVRHQISATYSREIIGTEWVRSTDLACMPRHRSGWSSNEEFRHVAGASARIQIPERAYSAKSTDGAGRECTFGDIEANDRCVPAGAPENGYINSLGNDWDFNRPCRKRSETCVLASRQ